MLSTTTEIERLLASGLRLHQAGHLADAERVYRQILTEWPDHATALHFLGVLAHQVGQYGVAAEHISRSVALVPNNARAHSNLGAAHRDNGQSELAVAACRQAIALDPNLPEAHGNLGNALKDTGQLDDAIVAYRRAVALIPAYADAHYNLGTALAAAGRLDEAVTAFRQAISLRPTHAKALNNLGNALKELGQATEAIVAYRQALALKPDYPEAHHNLGIALQDLRRVDESIAAYRQAIAFRPNFAEYHNNLALALLLRGDFREGWDEHEWRWLCRDSLLPQRTFAQSPWNGEALDGQTLLLRAEQGFGDTIQFIRYAPLAVQRGGKLLIECQAELVRLVQSVACGLQVVARGQPLPAFDTHCPLLSLPRIFATDQTNIPGGAPYLHAEIETAEKWRIRLASCGSALKVGLVWAGQPAHKNDHNRSMRLADFAPLAAIPGVSFFSLQKGAAAAQQAKAPGLNFDLLDLTAELNDFSDTAGLIANLDLVIGVDTAVVHLAGAMGKPVWTLLPFAPDWRWLRERDDSPWYPTMRLFRQPTRGDWGNVVRRVAESLHYLTQSR